MVHRLDARRPDFSETFERLLNRRREAPDDVRRAVADILASVRDRGDAAVAEHIRRFDRADLAPEGFAVGPEEIEAARAATPEPVVRALETARRRIEAFHRAQVPEGFRRADAEGVELGLRWTPVARVGVYVPGGRAAYPSSVLMNVVPARVAGCERVVMVTPAPDGVLNPVVLTAAAIAGVDAVFRVGGAQAVAALAYGTATIPAVDVVVGPGNAYVTEAKRQVYGRVGIDMTAGPSEVLVVADGRQDPAWIAADLLSQAEHDPLAQAILITDDAALAERVVAEVERQLASLPKADVAGPSWRDHGAVVLVTNLDDAPPLIDRVAPEHLEIMVEDPEPLARRVRNAGSVFLGPYTPEVIGDYVGGPNHVLPTSGSARFASGLSVFDFMKRTTYLRCDARSFALLAEPAATLARAEGLEGHARAIDLRRRATGEP